jgi:fibronectin-binding autotransporter adhesin
MVLSGSNSIFDSSSNTLAVAAAISGSGALTKTGTGVLVLSGTDTYSGGTIVLSGKLKITSPASLRDGSALTIGALATTKFAASVVPESQAAGETKPVPEPGTLAIMAVGACAAVACRQLTRRQLN